MLGAEVCTTAFPSRATVPSPDAYCMQRRSGLANAWKASKHACQCTNESFHQSSCALFKEYSWGHWCIWEELNK